MKSTLSINKRVMTHTGAVPGNTKSAPASLQSQVRERIMAPPAYQLSFHLVQHKFWYRWAPPRTSGTHRMERRLLASAPTPMAKGAF
ncbi:hypothetical protein VTH06DRAFT_2932 [Thermothelomyces fergusii]